MKQRSSWFAALAVVVLTTSACIDGSATVALPEIQPTTFPAEVQQQFDAMYSGAAASSPVVPVVPAGSTQIDRDTERYGRGNQYLSWQETEKGRGLVETGDRGVCESNAPECHRGEITGNQERMIRDVLKHAKDGGSTVTCSGSVDARSGVIGAIGQVELAGDRGADCAKRQAQALRAAAKEANQDVRVVNITRDDSSGVDCTAKGVICVEGVASDHVTKACGYGQSNKECEGALKAHKGTCSGPKCVKGRGASVEVAFNRQVCAEGTRLAGQLYSTVPNGDCNPEPPPVCPEGTKFAGRLISEVPNGDCNPCDPGEPGCTPKPRCPEGTKFAGRLISEVPNGDCNPETVITQCVPNPGEGKFCKPGNTGSTGNTGGTGSTGNPGNPGNTGNPPDTVSIATQFYCEIYPEDCLTAREVLETVTIRVDVSAPNPFIVGGALREQDVQVTSVLLYCGDTPCSDTDGVVLAELQAQLDLVTDNSAKYPRCASPTSRNCAYYISSASDLTVEVNQGRRDGNLLRAGFISPTPSGVSVRPTLKVSEASVNLIEYKWIGGENCDVDEPARSCWEELLGDAVDMLSNINVTVSGGGSTVRSGDSFYVNRRVIGTTGS